MPMTSPRLWYPQVVFCGLLACSSSPATGPRTGSGGTIGSGGAAAGSGGSSPSGGNPGMAGKPGSGGSGTAGSTTTSTGGTSGDGTGGDAGNSTGGSTGAAGSGGGAGGTTGGGGAGGGPATGGKAGGTGAGGGGPVVTPVNLPNNKPGIGFDDLRYSPELKKLLVPAGRTGELDLVDPQSNEVTTISGFSASTGFTLGKHRVGSTSADYGGGKIFAIDNETKTVRVVDPTTNMITSSTMLTAAPDYVRWVETTRELWVTMPQNPGVTVPTPEIEVLKVPDSGPPTHALNITFPASGPEALSIDITRHRAYTNNGTGGHTYAIDLMTHAVVETWQNGCSGLTVDLELDEARGFLMVACASGRLAVLDVAHAGASLGEVTMVGMGVDVSAYNPALHHAYLAGQDSADLSIIAISAAGKPTLLGKVPTANGSQMVAADEFGNAWVGDPGAGRLLKVRDTYAATP